MVNYGVMAKKEIRDVVRTNNRHLRNISNGNADKRLSNVNAIHHLNNMSVLALAELTSRGSTFEDVQLFQAAQAAYTKAITAVINDRQARNYLNGSAGKR